MRCLMGLLVVLICSCNNTEVVIHERVSIGKIIDVESIHGRWGDPTRKTIVKTEGMSLVIEGFRMVPIGTRAEIVYRSDGVFLHWGDCPTIYRIIQ